MHGNTFINEMQNDAVNVSVKEVQTMLEAEQNEPCLKEISQAEPLQGALQHRHSNRTLLTQIKHK